MQLFSFFWRKKTTDIWWDWLNHINFLLWVYWKHLYPKLGKMLARNVPHSNRSAIGVAESCRRIVIMWIKLHLATLVSWDFPWLHASRHWAKAQLSILTAEPEKTKVFCFSRWKKSERERKEDVVERNSSPSATALLNPYARLRGRKYPQFSVIRGRGRLPHWKGPGGTDWAPLRQARAEYASLWNVSFSCTV